MQPLLDDQNGLFSPQDTFGRGPPDKSQTRIRLLTSFQDSYLDDNRSASRNLNTEQADLAHLMHSSTGKPRQESIDQDQSLPTSAHFRTNQFKEEGQRSRIDIDRNPKDQEARKNMLMDKISKLQRNIDEELYNEGIQDKLFDFLNARISNRGKSPRSRDHDQIVEGAINFMDCGDQFLREYLKLKAIFPNRGK